MTNEEADKKREADKKFYKNTFIHAEYSLDETPEGSKRTEEPAQTQLPDDFFESFYTPVTIDQQHENPAKAIDKSKVQEEIKKLNPGLQLAFFELLQLEKAALTHEDKADQPAPSTAQDTDNQPDTKAPAAIKAPACLSIQGILALSQGNALDQSPELKKYLGGYFKDSFASPEEFEAKINALLDADEPEKTTDLLVLVNRFADLSDEEKEKLKEITQKAYEKMLEKAQQGNLRYAFEAQLLKQCTPFELKSTVELGHFNRPAAAPLPSPQNKTTSGEKSDGEDTKTAQSDAPSLPIIGQ